jgi:hypothetical protein
MRTALSRAVLGVALAACGEPTASVPATPLEAGRYAATFDGGLSGAGEGTALTYDLTRSTGVPHLWMELRDDRDAEHNTLVRFIVRSAALTPGRHAVGGSAAENPVDAVALEFHAGALTADVRFVGFTGSVEVDEATPAAVRGSFDVRSGGSGAVHAKGRFHAVPAPF